MTTKSKAVKATTKPEAAAPADVFEPLPEELRTAVTSVTSPQNAREAAGTHLNPRMGKLLRGFRQANGNVSQTSVAKGKVGDKDLGMTTTHCQIATLEQGGCKKGADSYTVKLLAEAIGVDESVIAAINEADLRERHEAGDKLAGKILGVAEEAEVDPAEVASETPDAASTESVPEPAALS